MAISRRSILSLLGAAPIVGMTGTQSGHAGELVGIEGVELVAEPADFFSKADREFLANNTKELEKITDGLREYIEANFHSSMKQQMQDHDLFDEEEDATQRTETETTDDQQPEVSEGGSGEVPGSSCDEPPAIQTFDSVFEGRYQAYGDCGAFRPEFMVTY